MPVFFMLSIPHPRLKVEDPAQRAQDEGVNNYDISMSRTLDQREKFPE